MPVEGWAFDDAGPVRVDVLIDGALAGVATYGRVQPFIGAFYPEAPTDIGYTYSLDTRRYADGAHTLNVRATDGAGNVALLRDIDLTFANR